MDAEFVIVGGGIGGAVLANRLARGGKRVVVLEKSAAPEAAVRPEILWPATMAVLSDLLSKEGIARSALPLRGVEISDGRRVATLITPERLEAAQVQPWSTDPTATRELLLRAGGFELRRGVEVVDILREKSAVAGVRTRNGTTGEVCEVCARWTVGDDGAHSRVRDACGIEMPTRLLPIDLLCYGFAWPEDLAPATARAWLNVRGSHSGILAAVAMPLPGGRGAGIVVVRPRIFDDLGAVQGAWEEFRAVHLALREMTGMRGFPQDFVRVRRPWGHAPRYGCEGAVLLGDAAHPVSPAGGQGANMSVADAGVLAELFLREAPEVPAEYERRRRPANERSLRFTRGAARVLGLPEWLLPPVWLGFAGLHWLSRRPELVQRFLRSAAAAFQSEPGR